MILEAAILLVKPEMTHAFEKDFALASKYISAAKGYLGHSLQKCLERENQYLLLVDWEDVESHEIGFRKSEAYQNWKALLHHYYEPFPVVQHYESVFQNKMDNNSSS